MKLRHCLFVIVASLCIYNLLPMVAQDHVTIKEITKHSTGTDKWESLDRLLEDPLLEFEIVFHADSLSKVVKLKGPVHPVTRNVEKDQKQVNALERAMMRAKVPKVPSAITIDPNNLCIATIKISSKSNSLVIGVHSISGFSLGGKVLDESNRFYSRELSDLFNDILRSQSFTHSYGGLSRTVANGLTGDSVRNAEKRIFYSKKSSD